MQQTHLAAMGSHEQPWAAAPLRSLLSAWSSRTVPHMCCSSRRAAASFQHAGCKKRREGGFIPWRSRAAGRRAPAKGCVRGKNGKQNEAGVGRKGASNGITEGQGAGSGKSMCVRQLPGRRAREEGALHGCGCAYRASCQPASCPQHQPRRPSGAGPAQHRRPGPPALRSATAAHQACLAASTRRRHNQRSTRLRHAGQQPEVAKQRSVGRVAAARLDKAPPLGVLAHLRGVGARRGGRVSRHSGRCGRKSRQLGMAQAVHTGLTCGRPAGRGEPPHTPTAPPPPPCRMAPACTGTHCYPRLRRAARHRRVQHAACTPRPAVRPG